MKKRLLLGLVLLLSIGLFAKIPAFPGAEGFGRYTVGGRGGSVYHVTTLEDGTQEGTLRYGCTKTGGNVTIVFDVSGTIHLTSALRLSVGNITIAGQTAPGDGICVADYPFTINSDNVIIRYMRFRLGNKYVAYHEGDGLGGMDNANVIVDHCSISWSIDECCSVYGSKNLTVQWCLIAQSLREAGHEKGAHGYGGNWGGSGASYHHNLLCDHESRTPRLGPRPFTQEDERMDMRNNIIYNWAGNGCYGGEGMNVNIVNNYYKPGPATKRKGGIVAYRIARIGIRTNEYCERNPSFAPMLHTWGKFYVNGNIMNGNSAVTNDNWTKGIYEQNSNTGLDGTYTQETKDTMKIDEPIDYPYTTTHSADQAYERVLDYAGASLSRDCFDSLMVSDTRKGVATYGNSNNLPGIVDSQNDNKPANASSDWSPWPTLKSTLKQTDSDNDGMPDEWELDHDLNPENPADANKYNDEGYTMLEVYLNGIVAGITEKQNEGGTVTGEIPDTTSVSVNAIAKWNFGYTAIDVAADSVSTGAFSSAVCSYTKNTFRIAGVENTYGTTFTKLQPVTGYKSPTDEACVKFTFTPMEGYALTPAIISFNCERYGTDGGYIDVVWENAKGEKSEIAAAVHPDRNNSGKITSVNIDLTKDRQKAAVGPCSLIFRIYDLGETKQIGLANIRIAGELNNLSDIKYVGKDKPDGDGFYYNIKGEKCNKIGKGLYIRNGAKILIK